MAANWSAPGLTEICHQIFGDLDVQTMWNFQNKCGVYGEEGFSKKNV